MRSFTRSSTPSRQNLRCIYLDPINRSVYQFSLKLNLWQQYKPEEGLEEGYITAFAVSPTKTIFLALENKVYLSHLP